MKKSIITLIIALTVSFIGAQEADATISIVKLGKGGVVITPGGPVKLCPQFSFRKCCKITITWSDIWNWITDDGCWDPDVNTNMPLPGHALVYDDNGQQTGEYDVHITWINPVSCADVNGNELTLEHPDILVEVIE